MKLITNNRKIEYEVRELINSYLPKTKFETADSRPAEGDYAVAIVTENDGIYDYFAEVSIGGRTGKSSDSAAEISKLHMGALIADIMVSLTGITLPWGILTGIRPAKMIRELRESGLNDDEIYSKFIGEYRVSPKKAALAADVARAEENICKSKIPNAVSLYIGIPFCPTRCLYCSFTSQSIKFSNTLTEPYMRSLMHEIDFVSHYLAERKIPIETLYIGGGTPTALDEGNLAALTAKIEKSFDLSSLREYTIEAGRPDTITDEKLHIMKECGVSRISINPQSMNQKTLNIIGRRHTPQDIISSFEAAEKCGFHHINADLIAGLPGESEQDFDHTLSEIKKLNPSSVTVHTMSIKHGSYLDKSYSMYTKTAAETVGAMLDTADSALRAMGKHPYYMYRQKNMLGNLENVGYCGDGGECRYNIYIMDEVQSVISLGAGASTKLVGADRIERVFNVKEVSEYIKRIDEMIERKKNLFLGGLL